MFWISFSKFLHFILLFSELVVRDEERARWLAGFGRGTNDMDVIDTTLRVGSREKLHPKHGYDEEVNINYSERW